MKLSEVKQALENLEQIRFSLPNGKLVPAHFHVTEIGQLDKKYIDCGGTVRLDQKINFQLWEADDFDHRLAPTKLLGIIKESEEKLNLTDSEILVEYQGHTIEKYALSFNNGVFYLQTTLTDCLAPNKCGVPSEKVRKQLDSIQNNSCDPASRCC